MVNVSLGVVDMRILHLVHQYMPEHIGGTELYTRWLTEALRERGHDVAVFHRQFESEQSLTCREEHGISIWAAWTGDLTAVDRFRASFHDPQMTQIFQEVLVAHQPDLVHVEHLMGLPIGMLNILRRREIPYIITLWDFWWICANAQLLTNYSHEICEGPQGYFNCARCALARVGHSRLRSAVPAIAGLLAWRGRRLRNAMQHADMLVAPTPFVYGWYKDHNVAAEQLLVLEPGLEAVRRNFDFPVRKTVDPLRFAYIGGLSWQKGIHILIKAFQQVSGPWELWIAGDKSTAPKYVAQLRNEARSHRIQFLGKLRRRQVWETLAQVDVVLVPSLWYETFSFIISEAFMMGVPVITSRLGPLADRVRDGIDGYLIPPGDVTTWRRVLQRLINDPALVERLKRGVQEPFTVNEHAAQIESLYARLV